VQQQPVFQLAASVVRACQQFVAVARERISQVLPHPPNVDKQVGDTTTVKWQLCTLARLL
jgi:hypothetical protein